MNLDLPGFAGRTFLESSTPTTTPSDASSPDWLAPLLRYAAQIPPRRDNSQALGFSTDLQAAGPGASWMLNMSAAVRCTAEARCPNAGSACSLSSVLEQKGIPVPRRCFLSREAKDGILTRSKRRGRKLPPMLDSALRA